MKAIGAKKLAVIMQIVSESSLISLIGGIAGVLLGIIGAAGLKLITGGAIPAAVTPDLAAIGIGFSLALGILGGIYPGIRAAALDPVEALRYE